MNHQGKLTVLAGCVALLFGAAHAQSPARDSARDTDASATSDGYAASLRHRDYLQGADLRASQIVGAPIRNMEGETLGDIDELVIGEGGRLLVVLGVGGFLGVGEKRVAVPYDELRISPDGDAFFVNHSRATLESEPSYTFRERTDSSAAQLAQRAQTDRPQTQVDRSQPSARESQAERADVQRQTQEQRAARDADQLAGERRETTIARGDDAASGAALGADDHRASTIIGAKVVDSAGQEVGEIDDLVVSSETGDIQAVLSVGGVAGIGAKLVAVPFDDLQIAPGESSTNEAPRLRLDISAQHARESLPEFRYERQVAQGSATSPRG